MGRQKKQVTLQVRSDETARPARRGRPPKFGRPSSVVALTLPDEVLEALQLVHRDLGWAIVRLVEPILRGARARPPNGLAPLAELVNLPGSRALIVVQPDVFRSMAGVSLIPLADGRAFLAFEHAGRLADFEVAILDELERAPGGSRRREQLKRGLGIVRAWRRDPNLAASARSIIVVERRRRQKALGP